MQMKSAAQILPSVYNDKKIEVSLAEGGEAAVLKLSTWTEDLGWCCQKTMRIEAEMLADLHRAVAAARYKLNQRQTENTESAAAVAGAKILGFPSLA